GLVAVVEELRQQVFQGALGLPPPGAKLHEGGVDGDAMEPGAELRLPVEAVDAPERREQGVAGVFLVTEDAPRDGEEPAAVLPHELLEGHRIRVAEAIQEGGIVHAITSLRAGNAPGRWIHYTRRAGAKTSLERGREEMLGCGGLSRRTRR